MANLSLYDDSHFPGMPWGESPPFRLMPGVGFYPIANVTPLRDGWCWKETPKKHNIMKYKNHMLVALTAILTLSCNKEKIAIDDKKEATEDAIDSRKDAIDANAKMATKKTDANAEIDKANIEANKESMQAQLDAQKKKAQAEADAAKAKVDAENR